MIYNMDDTLVEINILTNSTSILSFGFGINNVKVGSTPNHITMITYVNLSGDLFPTTYILQ